MTFLADLLQQALAWTVPEFVAVVAAIGYLLLAIRQNIWCWLFAGLSTAIYIGLFAVAKLYMESVLNAFYLVMAVYGWRVWSTGRTAKAERPVVVWPMQTHLIAVIGLTAVSAANGYILAVYSDAAFPYVDSLTTWFAIWATFLVARKVLENWWYWLIIDIASILIYWSRDLQLTALLFAVYVAMIPFGLMSWTKSMKTQVT